MQKVQFYVIANNPERADDRCREKRKCGDNQGTKEKGRAFIFKFDETKR